MSGQPYHLSRAVDAVPGGSVLLVGDSVMAALSGGSPGADHAIIGTDGWTVSMKAKVYRKSTTPGCLHARPA